MNNVRLFIELISSMNSDDLINYTSLETCLFKAGLNNENLGEQPPELKEYFGTGYALRIWQYPNQFIPYLLFLEKYKDKIISYLEIGSRYGGTFIFVNEYLNTIKKQQIKSFACDIIEIPENISRYQELNSNVSYLPINSQSDDFKNFIKDSHFSLIFIDGDHTYEGVKKDAEVCLDHGEIIVFHDITSVACPGTSKYWIDFKNQYSDMFNFYEFVEQYPSIRSNFLGIGCAVKKQFDH